MGGKRAGVVDWKGTYPADWVTEGLSLLLLPRHFAALPHFIVVINPSAGQMRRLLKQQFRHTWIIISMCFSLSLDFLFREQQHVMMIIFYRRSERLKWKRKTFSCRVGVMDGLSPRARAFSVINLIGVSSNHHKKKRHSSINAELIGDELWKEFHALGTEMIITKAGR